MKNGKTIVLESGIEVLLAEYREQEIIDYKGNPLLKRYLRYSLKKKRLINLAFTYVS